MPKINFSYGQVVEFETLTPNTIALDGAVQGPKMDPKTRRFSFDHHAECERMVTLATCQQVHTALHLGLVVDEETEIVINDIDADTVVSVWLLQNPERASEPKIAELVERIGRTDAYGPIYPAHFVHGMISLGYGNTEDQTLAKLEEFLQVVTDYADGKLEEPEAKADPCEGYGWSPKAGWQHFELENGFDEMYESGCLAGFIYAPIGETGTYFYMVAKRSDLVPVRLGPGSAVRPVADPEQFDKTTLLGSLAVAELTVNPEQSLAATWGGGSSVGGSPRNEDGSGSKLGPKEVLAIFEAFTG